jgi:hypothetical protein
MSDDLDVQNASKKKKARAARYNWKEGDVEILPKRTSNSSDGIPFEQWYVENCRQGVGSTQDLSVNKDDPAHNMDWGDWAAIMVDLYNYNPSHDTKGRFASGGGRIGAPAEAPVREAGRQAGRAARSASRAVAKKGVELAKAAGAKLGHIEHVVKQAVLDKVSSTVAKLPGWLQTPVMGAYHVGKTATKAAFVTWTAGQAFAERVAKERGMSAEEARKFRGTLTAMDVFSFKPISAVLHYGVGLHAGALSAVSLIPPASAAYLAHSTAKHPHATYAAAKGVVRDTITRLAAGVGKKKEPTTLEPVVAKDYTDEQEAIALANTNKVADALHDHSYEDWYIALLHVALDEVDDVGHAIEVANAAYEEVSSDPSNGKLQESAWDLFGVTKAQALEAFGLDEEALAAQNSETWQEFLGNFNPGQARVPAGQKGGGRFAKGEGGGTGGGGAKAGVAGEKSTAPPPGSHYKPDVEKDHNGDGVTDAARIGVNAMSVPPPPPVGKLPNLTSHERQVETEFRDAYHADPDGMARDFRKVIESTRKEGEAPTFGTDDAKVLHEAWVHDDITKRAENRATLNNALHQVANAVAKRAFLQELDTLKKGDEVMVTVGGCGAGKGYALKNVPEALAMKNRSKVVWDSAGDQNATENPWIQKEAESRGLKVNYVFVHADPYSQWAHPERGVVKRAGDPSDGRMVDAKVFADSYALGAKNHQAFHDKHKDNPNANFVFLANTGKPSLIPGVPKEALGLDRRELARFAIKTVHESSAPAHVKRGGTVGERIWADD